MSAFTTDNLDDAVLAGYSFLAVVDALNAGDDAEAGRQLRKVLELRVADGDEDPEDLGELGRAIDSLASRLAIVPVLGVAR